MSIDFPAKCPRCDNDLTVKFTQTPFGYYNTITDRFVRTEPLLEREYRCSNGHTFTEDIEKRVGFSGPIVTADRNRTIEVHGPVLNGARLSEIRNESLAANNAKQQEVLTQQAVSIFFNLA